MRLPNKVTTYKESCFSKFPIVLSNLSVKKKSPYELYNALAKNFDSVTEFIDTLDCLFALEKLTYDEDREILYVI